MLTIRDQIDQLRLELTGCLLTRRERVQANAELKRLLAAQAERDRALDMSASGRPPIASMSGGRCWCAPERCHAEVLIELANR